MSTDKFMEDIRGLDGVLGRKNWKSPQSQNTEIASVLSEADDFMGRTGWVLDEKKEPIDKLKSPDTAFRMAQKIAQQGPDSRLTAAKYAIYGAILIARKLKHRKLMVALGKAYQMVEEDVEKEDLGA